MSLISPRSHINLNTRVELSPSNTREAFPPSPSRREKHSLPLSQGERSIRSPSLKVREGVDGSVYYVSLANAPTLVICVPTPSIRERLSHSLKEREGVDGSVNFVSLAALRVTAEGRNP